MNKLFKVLILLVLAGIILFSGGQLLYYKHYSDENSALHDELIQEVVTVLPDNSVNENNTEDMGQVINVPMMIDFTRLKSRNPDTIAWLYSPDTPINYPILQSSDNSTYLRRAFDGSYSYYGSLFLDYRCDSFFEDQVNIIYGHNMGDGEMLGSLKDYTDQDYYNVHNQIYLFTSDADLLLRPFAGCIVSKDSVYFTLPFYGDLQELIQSAVSESTFDADYPDDQDRIVILSTCSSSKASEDYRFLLFCTISEISSQN